MNLADSIRSGLGYPSNLDGSLPAPKLREPILIRPGLTMLAISFFSASSLSLTMSIMRNRVTMVRFASAE